MPDAPDLAAALDLLERRVIDLVRDRDYWRRQHDLVLADWKDDLARLEPSDVVGDECSRRRNPSAFSLATLAVNAIVPILGWRPNAQRLGDGVTAAD